MLIEHLGKKPNVAPSAIIAPTAVICGDVTIGDRCCVGFGAVIVADRKPIRIGDHCIIRDQAVIRSTAKHPVSIGNSVLIGPHSTLLGCTIEDEVFLATGCAIFHAAKIGKKSEVRIHGVVHLKSVLPEKSTVPIGWIAVGNPAQILPPDEHEKIWAIQKPLNFPMEVYGVERGSDGNADMKKITFNVAESLSSHNKDREIK
jgi:carbonic anhydrase/acetyltransferase-like protein (isoleucine patch superfamily)